MRIGRSVCRLGIVSARIATAMLGGRIHDPTRIIEYSDDARGFLFSGVRNVALLPILVLLLLLSAVKVWLIVEALTG